MKNIIVSIVLLLGFRGVGNCQVGIGTNTPNPSAILHLETTAKGFLPPRLSRQQRDSIQSPANGLMVYNTSSGSVEYYNGTLAQWVSINGNLPSVNQSASGYLSVTANTTSAFGFYAAPNGTGTWSNISLGSNGSMGLVAISGAVVAYGSNIASTFYKNALGNGVWASVALSGNTPSAAVGDNVAIVFNNLNAYAFYRDPSGNGVWVPVSFGSSSSSTSCSIGPNDVAYVKTTTAGYVFYFDNQGHGRWSSQAISGTIPLQLFSK